jgi:hypothetical protein
MVTNSFIVLYQERLWTKTYVASELSAVIIAAMTYLFYPRMANAAIGILPLILAFAALSPYKIVITSKSLEVRDLVNLFGWKVNLSDISRVSLRQATNRIEVTYRYNGIDRSKVVRSANPKLLLESLTSVAPHTNVETV